MNVSKREITFAEARARAENEARSTLKNYTTDPNMPVLRDEYLEAEHCWMFFRNPDIKFPDLASGDGFLPSWAYCWSKHGEGRAVADFSDDPAKCRAYLQKMSDYFKEKGL
jgi:hypothetical protein